MNITLTLTAGLGADLGPNFNLTANVGSVTPSTATKTELTNGISVSVDNAATQVTITSTGTCTNALTLNISGIPATTTTTTTTTEAPTTTTTTTTAAPICKEYQITSTDPTYGADINGTDCYGNAYSDTGFFGTVNLCFLENQISVSGGTFSLLGDCTPPTTTTTTTTTTEAPTTTTTTLAETIWCDCGSGCSEYIGFTCPPGCLECAPP